MSDRRLLSPVTVGGIDLRNRVVLAPMTRARAGETRVPNALMSDYYAQRASAGLLVTEATVISSQGIGWIDSPGIYTDSQAVAWKPVVNAVHEKKSTIFLQLWHCGRASHSSFHGGELPVAPSAIAIQADGIHAPAGKVPHEVPRALETDEIPAIVADYRRAAARAREAGFDGVEVHAANGYLIDQFLQSRSNKRADRYGGSLENRLRFLEEIVDSLTEVIPADRIGVRISPNGVYNDMGSPDYRETFLEVARRLAPRGLAYLHVVDGLAFGFHQQGTPMTLAEFRPLFTGPLIGNCGYTRETAEEAIARGDADLIAFGRPFIANPDLVERFAHGWPLAEAQDPSTWYSPGARGYTDYPAHAD